MVIRFLRFLHACFCLWIWMCEEQAQKYGWCYVTRYIAVFQPAIDLLPYHMACECEHVRTRWRIAKCKGTAASLQTVGRCCCSMCMFVCDMCVCVGTCHWRVFDAVQVLRIVVSLASAHNYNLCYRLVYLCGCCCLFFLCSLLLPRCVVSSCAHWWTWREYEIFAFACIIHITILTIFAMHCMASIQTLP